MASKLLRTGLALVFLRFPSSGIPFLVLKTDRRGVFQQLLRASRPFETRKITLTIRFRLQCLKKSSAQSILIYPHDFGIDIIHDTGSVLGVSSSLEVLDAEKTTRWAELYSSLLLY